MLGQFVIPKRKNGYIVGCCLLFSVSFFLALSPGLRNFFYLIHVSAKLNLRFHQGLFQLHGISFFYLIEQKNKES